MAIDLDAMKAELASNRLGMPGFDVNRAIELIAEVERLQAILTAGDCENCPAAWYYDHQVQRALEAEAEIERLRAELTTTLVACDPSMRARDAVAGMCPECAQVELAELRREVKRFNAAWQAERDERVRLANELRDMLEKIDAKPTLDGD